jgi:hypothetical protein
MTDMKLIREITLQENDEIKSRPLDMQEPYQWQGWIAKREGRIKLHTISNPAISLDCHISSTQRSMTLVDIPICHIKSGPLDTQVPDQGQGYIVESERIIK